MSKSMTHVRKTFSKKTEGALSSMNMLDRGNRVIYWCMFAMLVILALICVLPPVWIMISSFKTPKELLQIPPALLPSEWNLQKFKEIWNNLNFGKYYLNTIEIAVGSVVFSVVCNGLAGYVLSCLRPKFSGLFAGLILWTMLLPNTLSMVAQFMNICDFPIFGWNLTNTFWPMWFVRGANAFQILLYKDYFDGISKSLIEAAMLDGCSKLQVFGKIVLPLSKPIIAVDAIFTVTGVWGDFMLPYLTLSEKNLKTVMLAIYDMSTTTIYSIDEQLVGIVFSIIPPVLIFFFLQKYIMGGLTTGGVKE